MSLEQVERIFGQYQHSNKRPELFEQLRTYIKELRRAEIAGWLILDGSFLMACVDEPSDIDLVLVLPRTWNYEEDIAPFRYNLVSRKDIKRNYRFDVFVAPEGSRAESNMVEYFTQVNPKWYETHGFDEGATKGLARIEL